MRQTGPLPPRLQFPDDAIVHGGRVLIIVDFPVVATPSLLLAVGGNLDDRVVEESHIRPTADLPSSSPDELVHRGPLATLDAADVLRNPLHAA